MDQGIVIKYFFDGNNWKISAVYTDPDNQDNGEYGWSVDTDGIHRIVGMPKSNSAGNGMNYGKVVIGPLD